MAVGFRYPPLLLEAATQQPAAAEAEAAYSITSRQQAGSSLCTAASGSPITAQHSISTRPLTICHVSCRRLMLPSTLPPSGTMSAVAAYSSTHSSTYRAVASTLSSVSDCSLCYQGLLLLHQQRQRQPCRCKQLQLQQQRQGQCCRQGCQPDSSVLQQGAAAAQYCRWPLARPAR